ncbi:ethionine resistance protein [Coemansia sp. RSA 1813]|nr:ethionine resistance protein [Coemansia sp. RSA 1813]
MATTSQSQQGAAQESGESCGVDEATPLLHMPLSELDLAIANNDTSESYVYAAKREIKWIASSSSLTTLTLFLEVSFYTVNVLSVGHLGAKELGAMTLAATSQMIIATAPTFGLLAAMDTFCSTAYTASRDKTLVGFHFQRGIISVCTLFVIAAPILWNSENILLLLKQDPEIAHFAGLYLRIHILSMLPFVLFEATKRYLQAQGIMRAGTIVTMIVAPIHWINSYVFVRSSRFGIGFVGAPVINVFSNCLLLIGILLYARNSRATETWGGWKLSAFHNMWAYYRLAIPAVITLCCDWICVELLALGASSFGANQLAGHAIMLNSIGLIYQVSNGFGSSTSPRIGNLIGAAKARQARIAADMSILASTFIGVAGTLFISLCGGWWTQLYTVDPNVARETARLIPVACVLIVSDGLEAVLSAILRGLGRQKVGANVLIFGYYVCGVPAAIYLGYIKHMETPGLWWGLCIGIIVVSSLQIIYIYLWIDWKDEVRLCLVRLKGNNSTNNTVENSSE